MIYGCKCRSQICSEEVGDTKLAKNYFGETLLTGVEIIHETTENIVQIQDIIKVTRNCQKSYVERKHKPVEIHVGDHVMLKVYPWKGVTRFGKRGKKNPRYIGLFEFLARISHVAYKLKLP